MGKPFLAENLIMHDNTRQDLHIRHGGRTLEAVNDHKAIRIDAGPVRHKREP